MSETGQKLRALIDGLAKFKVTNWAPSSNSPNQEADRERVLDTEQADVVSSLLRASGGSTAEHPGGRHMVLLDIDHQAWLVKSGTPGHYHLYIEVPGGIDWIKYATMLLAMADAGVIEQGYANVSIKRGHSDLRLPWKPKPVSGNQPGFLDEVRHA